MQKYNMVEGSRGAAPRFAITVGLQEGYGPTGKSHTTEEVVALVEGFLKECAASGCPFLTGSVTSGSLVYAWPESKHGPAGAGHEPNAVYSGEKNPLYNSAMTAEQVSEFLNELATRLGSALGQTRIYVAYDGDMWILQKEKSTTPTGETS